MSLYTTPLQFGYFLALLLAILLWYRGWHDERLSDKLLGFVLFFLAMEIQDYTFGFAGINILWEEFDGFPRYFSLAFAPTIYFYLKAQINREYHLTRANLLHYIPYAVYFVFNAAIFFQGKSVVEAYRSSQFLYFLNWLETIAIWTSYIYYFKKSLQLYTEYRAWIEMQFSDIEVVSFVWLRNFIYLIIAGEVFKWGWSLADKWLGDLPFEQDWWWHLFTVAIICYVGINGYSQIQPKRIAFGVRNIPENPKFEDEYVKTIPIADYSDWKSKIEKLFVEQKIYLEPELSLTDLAQKLKTNTSVLSAAINSNFGKNFNDFVNEYRVEEFKKQIKLPENQHFTLLSVAFDCGFNSKATFNRAFKKITGHSPSRYT